MSKLTVVVDSIACIPRDLKQKYGIEVVPINVKYDDSIYRDGVDLDADKAYEFLKQAPELWESSPPSPAEYLDVFRKAVKRGNDVLCSTLSSKLSGAFDVATIARDMVKAEFPDASIEVVDSLTATASEGLLAIEIGKFAEKGKDIQDVKQFALKARQRLGVIFLIDTLKHVYRTGRIPKIASNIGNMLPVKPILAVKNGKVGIAGLSRTRKGGIQRMIKMLRNDVKDNLITVAIQHAQVLKEAKELLNVVESEFNCTNSLITEFSPVMGYATGTGALGIAYYRE